MSQKNILVIGGGGREHAIIEKLLQDQNVGTVFCSPGNGGIGKMYESRVRLIPSCSFPELASFARSENVHLTIVGPKKPLVGGIVDHFQAEGLRIFGPTRVCARIEGSKVACTELLSGKVPMPKSECFDDADAAKRFIASLSYKFVIKADGIAAGKGVYLPSSLPEAEQVITDLMTRGSLDGAGKKIVIQERLMGRECSILAFCDGKSIRTFMPARDHKAALDGDEGPNTGGMGCYAPVPDCTPTLQEQILREILYPAMDAMNHEKGWGPYKGVLHAGIMLTADGPKLLEFNCRFGDPETQILLEMMSGDLLPYLEAVVDGTLRTKKELRFVNGCGICLVLATPGYPGNFPKNLAIEGFTDVPDFDTNIIHAGTAESPDGQGFVTSGGRVLGITAVKQTFSKAVQSVYAGAKRFKFGGQTPMFRTDIGNGL